MRENGLNAFLLHFIHKGIALDCNAIIDDYAKRNQKRMSFISDSSMPRSDWFSVIFGGCNSMNKGNDAVDSCLSLLLRFSFGNRLWEKSIDCCSKTLPEYYKQHLLEREFSMGWRSGERGLRSHQNLIPPPPPLHPFFSIFCIRKENLVDRTISLFLLE